MEIELCVCESDRPRRYYYRYYAVRLKNRRIWSTTMMTCKRVQQIIEYARIIYVCASVLYMYRVIVLLWFSIIYDLRLPNFYDPAVLFSRRNSAAVPFCFQIDINNLNTSVIFWKLPRVIRWTFHDYFAPFIKTKSTESKLM